MLGIIGWIIWTFSAFIALSLTYKITEKIKSKVYSSRGTLYQGLFLWLVLLLMLLNPSISKFHLIWIIPIIFPLIGYITFRFFSY